MNICEKHYIRYDMCSDCVSELISENESLKKKVSELEDRCALAESISKEHHDAIGKYLSLNKEFVRQQRELDTFKRAVNHVVPMGKTKSSYTCPLCKAGFESYIDVELVKYDGCNITCPKCLGFLTILRGRIVSEAQARDEEHEIKMQEIQKHLESLTANDKRYRLLRDNRFLDNICPDKAQDSRAIDLHIDVVIKEKQNNDKSVF